MFYYPLSEVNYEASTKFLLARFKVKTLHFFSEHNHSLLANKPSIY